MPEVPIKITVDDEEAKQKLGELPQATKEAEEGVRSLNDRFKDLFKGARKGVDNVTKRFDKGFKKIGGSDKALETLKGSFGGLKQAGIDALGGLDGMLGGLPSKFMGINKGAKVAGTGMKGFKAALASTGIGLIVIALGELVGYLMKLSLIHLLHCPPTTPCHTRWYPYHLKINIISLHILL